MVEVSVYVVRPPILTKRHHMARGTAKWFNGNKGFSFGFTSVDGGADVFVHFPAIQTEGFRCLTEDQRAEFDVTQGPKGPQAGYTRALCEPAPHARRGPDRRPRP